MGLAFIAACTSGKSTSESEPDIESSPTPHILDDGLNLSLVGNTGRPQFIYSFAKWWPTWQANKPIVDGLEETFSDSIDFFGLDTDLSETLDLREKYGLYRRTTYVLIDAEGNELGRWIGPLYKEWMEDEIIFALDLQ